MNDWRGREIHCFGARFYLPLQFNHMKTHENHSVFVVLLYEKIFNVTLTCNHHHNWFACIKNCIHWKYDYISMQFCCVLVLFIWLLYVRMEFTDLNVRRCFTTNSIYIRMNTIDSTFYSMILLVSLLFIVSWE